MLIPNLLLDSRMLRGLKILVVDNDRDSRDLYTVLLNNHGAKVITLGAIEDTMNLLSWYTPDILICEMRFLGESVYPMIQKVEYLALSRGKKIPIVVTSTCSLQNLARQLKFKVAAYLLKPIDVQSLISEILNLTLPETTACQLKC